MRGPLALFAAFALSLSAAAQAADWQKDWEGTLAAAKKEGTVVVVGSPDPVMRNEIIPRFQSKFGIQIEFIAGSSGPIVGRIRTERGSGIYSVDVYLSGSNTTVTVLYPEKMIDPLKPMLILPEVAEAKYWRRGEPWFMDPEHRYIMELFASVDGLLMINTDYVKRDELRTTKDLIDPKWQGRIVSEDPMASGSGSNTAAYFLMQRGPEYIKQVYQGQKVVVSRDRRQMTDWLARGTYPICLTCRLDDTAKLREEGYKIEEVFKLDDLPNRVNNAPFVMTVANKAPHPNAAKVFVNWMAGKEALETYSRGYGAANTRTDTDQSFLDPKILPKIGEDYVDETTFDWLLNGRRNAAEQVRKLLRQQ
jgi:iron(III) transport system substrate-binding protein